MTPPSFVVSSRPTSALPYVPDNCPCFAVKATGPCGPHMSVSDTWARANRRGRPSVEKSSNPIPVIRLYKQAQEQTPLASMPFFPAGGKKSQPAATISRRNGASSSLHSQLLPVQRVHGNGGRRRRHRCDVVVVVVFVLLLRLRLASVQHGLRRRRGARGRVVARRGCCRGLGAIGGCRGRGGAAGGA